MKKLVVVAAVLFGATTMFAQDLTSKKGENYLPEEGDWAIGMDAVPFLNYIGNFFGKDDNPHAGSIWVPSNTTMALTGKYFMRDDFAIRGGLRLGFGSSNETNTVSNLHDPSSSNPWPDMINTVENKMKTSYTNVGINGGVEWRKGNTRLQGYYGGEFGFVISSNSSKYVYGNDLDVAKGVGVSSADDFGSNLGTTVDGMGFSQNTRQLSNKSGLTFAIGARAFVGAEYFVIPKLSIGGELGWGIGFALNGKSSVESEAIGYKDGATDPTVETIVRKGDSSTSFGVDNALINPLFGPVGSLNITFHF